MTSRKIVFAGGGTAGHIQPALAVARLWEKTYPADEIVFLGTSSGLETKLVPDAGFDLQLITRVRVPRSLLSDVCAGSAAGPAGQRSARLFSARDKPPPEYADQSTAVSCGMLSHLPAPALQFRERSGCILLCSGYLQMRQDSGTISGFLKQWKAS